MNLPLEMFAAKDTLVNLFSLVPGVRGVDIGLRVVEDNVTDESVLRVLVADIGSVPAFIPPVMNGFPVVIIERQDTPRLDLGQYDPVVGGGANIARFGTISVLQ
jgi:hypothetical protein